MRYLFILSFFFVVHQTIAQSISIENKTFQTESGLKVEGQVGSILVPENRANPNSSAIPIQFVHLKSTNPQPSAPIFYLEGGPGSSCTWQADNDYYLEYWSKFLAIADVVLVDQRGTGKSSERLTYIWMDAIPEGIFQDYQVAQQHYSNMAKKALPSFQERGIDLRGYTTKENATDIDQLRQALGFEKINLFGFSYGSHLGQAYQRYFGESVDKTILIGVEGPDHTYKLPLAMDVQLQKISQMAQQDPAIAKEVPNVFELYKEVAAQLEKEPAEVTVRSPLTGEKETIKVGAFGLNIILRLDIGDASDLPVFPRLLYQIKQKDYSALAWFVNKRYRMVFGIQGMSATMDLASGSSPSRQLRIKEDKTKSQFGEVVNITLDVFDEMDGFWPDPDLGEEFRSPLITDIPTLFLSGTLDFNTPPHQAEEVRWGYSNSQHIIVQNAGHEQIISHPQTIPTILSFLKGKNIQETTFGHGPLQFIPLEGSDSEVWHPALGKR